MLHDLRFGVRMLAKDPWFTLLAAVALGLAIGVNNTVFTFVNAVLLRGLPFKDSQQIMLLNSRGADRDELRVSYPDFEDWRAQSKTFSALSVFTEGTMNVSDSSHPPERIMGAWLGLAIGLAGAIAVSRALSVLLVQTKPYDPLSIGAISTLLAGITLVACLVPARRATRLDPLAALRE